MAGFNWGSGATGAGIGAAVGGPIGAGIGGLAGGLFGGSGGSKEKLKKIETMSPEQKQQFLQLLQMLGSEGDLGQGFGEGISALREMLDPSSAAQQRFAAPYLQQFNEQTVPGLAERFAGAGAQGGALSSSGFGQALSSAGGQLQNSLAALKSGLMNQAIQSLFGQYSNLSNQAMGAQPFAYYQKPGKQGLGESLMSNAGSFSGLFG